MSATARDSREQEASSGRLTGQGSLLFAGYGLAQALSFARNAILGHALSKGDFGIAATITLLLQLVETITDLGADRLIVQADDGAEPRFLAASHALLVARGVLLSLILLAAGPALANFFAVPEATPAFQLAALSPLVKSLMHLDWRRAQRQLRNTPHLIVEVVPQAVALVATLPVLAVDKSYVCIVWIAIAQAIATVVASHVISTLPYRMAFDRAILLRQVAFGWPILASALPLVAVYQGDRFVIARHLGMESLASFTVAFMVTMVPGLIAAKVGHALLLPLFAESRRQSGSLRAPFAIASEAAAVLAALYAAMLIIAGGALLPVVFGANYAGLNTLVSWLALMWALRMLQAVPGMALMAASETRPFLVAGVIRAHALPVVLLAATQGASLDFIAAIGAAFELLSLAYVSLRIERLERGLGANLVFRCLFVIPAAGFAWVAAVACTGNSVAGHLVGALAASTLLAISGLALMPGFRAEMRARLGIGEAPLSA